MGACRRAGRGGRARCGRGAACVLGQFTVTKTADTADGVCDADCSLREAITAYKWVARVGHDHLRHPCPYSPADPAGGYASARDHPATADRRQRADRHGWATARHSGRKLVPTPGPLTNGLVFASGSLGSAVNKIAFTRWNTGNGAGLSIAGGSTVTVTGSLFGTDATGAAALGNYAGISVSGAATIGGTTAAERNVVSGNVTGIFITGSASVKGNWIGVGLDGSSALPNSFQGIFAQTFAETATTNRRNAAW